MEIADSTPASHRCGSPQAEHPRTATPAWPGAAVTLHGDGQSVTRARRRPRSTARAALGAPRWRADESAVRSGRSEQW
jgi:hypothetical protein